MSKEINHSRRRFLGSIAMIGLAEGEPKYDELEKRLSAAPVIAVPTLTLEGDATGAPHPDAGSCAKKFSGKYSHRRKPFCAFCASL
jgi:hypothetical protein